MHGAPQALGWRPIGETKRLLTLAFTTKAAASPRAVWRALSSSDAASHWLPYHEGWRGEAPSLAPGARLFFRSRMRRVPVTGLLHVHEVAPMRMRAQLRLGLFSCELRFALAAERKTPGATRIGLVLSLANEIALAGASLDRFDARKLASEVAEQLLGAMVAFVERAGEPPPDPSSP